METGQSGFDKLNGYFRFEPEKGILPDKKDEVIVNRAIQFNKVKFGFTPEEMLLHDINFTAEEGKKSCTCRDFGLREESYNFAINWYIPPVGWRHYCWRR